MSERSGWPRSPFATCRRIRYTSLHSSLKASFSHEISYKLEWPKVWMLTVDSSSSVSQGMPKLWQRRLLKKGAESCNRRFHIKNPSHRSEEHTSELQSRENLVCRLLLEKK